VGLSLWGVIAYRFADFRAFMARNACSCEERFEKRCLAAGIRSDKRNAAGTSAVRIAFAHFDLPLPELFFLGRAPQRAAKRYRRAGRGTWQGPNNKSGYS
jgi:hypothetical protein